VTFNHRGEFIMQTLSLSPAYRSAIWFALALQIPIALVLVLLLDGGHLARAGGLAMLAFWLIRSRSSGGAPSGRRCWTWRTCAWAICQSSASPCSLPPFSETKTLVAP
jgi:hypothetical protein